MSTECFSAHEKCRYNVSIKGRLTMGACRVTCGGAQKGCLCAGNGRAQPKVKGPEAHCRASCRPALEVRRQMSRVQTGVPCQKTEVSLPSSFPFLFHSGYKSNGWCFSHPGQEIIQPHPELCKPMGGGRGVSYSS